MICKFCEEKKEKNKHSGLEPYSVSCSSYIPGPPHDQSSTAPSIVPYAYMACPTIPIHNYSLHKICCKFREEKGKANE